MGLDVLVALGIAGHEVFLHIIIHAEGGGHLAVTLGISTDRCVISQVCTCCVLGALGLIERLYDARKVVEQARCPSRCAGIECLGTEQMVLKVIGGER